MSMRGCQWQLPAFGHSNPRTVQKAPVFSLFANGPLRAYMLLSEDPFTNGEGAVERTARGACLTQKFEK